ncbi:MAG TPA: S8 family serine peptidase [Blastocatellia bacterium]|nr:S8 family serine peptidase [Blastocatellia bacterium]
MRKWSVLALVCMLCLAVIAPRTRVSATRSQRNPKTYAPGQIIVKLMADAPELQYADPLERETAVARMSLASARSTDQRRAEPVIANAGRGRMSQIISERGLDRVFVLDIGGDTDMEAALRELRARPDVEYAEPNYLIEPASVVPTDPRFFDQWGLKNYGYLIDGNSATPGADTHVTDAWEITKGSRDVIVAVTDTGVDITHPDLAGSIYTNPREIPGNGVDDDGDGYVDDVHGYNVGENNNDVTDIFGHGTQIAGVIAAGIDNNVGIAGVAQVSIMPVRFFRKTGPDPSQFEATVVEATRALVYAAAAGASVINASWRSLGSVDQVTDDQLSLLQDAIYATNDAGALLVSIAGNEGYNNDNVKVYPGAFQLPNQIVVAASDFNDGIWRDDFYPFSVRSGFGPKTVAVAAPGVSIITITPHGNCLLCSQSDDPADWYTHADGTSLSAAFVSGVAALVKSKYPSDNAMLLKARIVKSVDVLSQLAPYVSTSGRVNALAALNVQVQLNITPPVLNKVKFKAGKGKLTVIGAGLQKGVRVVVGNKGYTPISQEDDNTAAVVKVPKTTFPPGVAVPIKLRNPDGGESQTILLTQ